MKSWMVFISIGVFLTTGIITPSGAEQVVQDTQMDQAIHEARKVSSELADKVRGLLFQEIEKGGFPSAVKVCSEVAQDITHQFTNRTGHSIRWVSLRYRNPKNVPDDYERRKLEASDHLQPSPFRRIDSP